jgi:hypothetical protein
MKLFRKDTLVALLILLLFGGILPVFSAMLIPLIEKIPEEVRGKVLLLTTFSAFFFLAALILKIFKKK